MGLGTERSVKQFEECLKVEFATKTLRSGYQRGDLAESDFAHDFDQTNATATRSTTSQLLPCPDSIKAKVATLDAQQAQNLIASFLRGME
jgi:hypothetical protein